jgi:hypothetical protein
MDDIVFKITYKAGSNDVASIKQILTENNLDVPSLMMNILGRKFEENTAKLLQILVKFPVWRQQITESLDMLC